MNLKGMIGLLIRTHGYHSQGGAMRCLPIAVTGGLDKHAKHWTIKVEGGKAELTRHDLQGDLVLWFS